MRQRGRMITFNDAQYMVANEHFSEKQTIPSSNYCMTKQDIENHLLYQADLSDYNSNHLVPYHRISPHFWQFISAYYKLDESSGDVIDSKGHKTTTVPSSVVRPVPGKIGTAYDFRNEGFAVGNNTFFDFSENGINHPVSFCCWVKFLSTGSAPIFSNQLSDSRWTFRFETIGSDLVVRVRGGIEETSTTDYIGRKATNFDFKVNTWQLVGFSFSGGSDSSSLKLYQNAVRIDNTNMNSGSFNTALNATISAKFFRNGDGTQSFLGYGDEVIFLQKYEMKQEDFEYIYNDGIGRELSPPTI